jgi:hypothetical protein
MSELLARFFIGGLVVSSFAALGDILKPKSFAGLFSAAPSVALASIGLVVAKHGHSHVATEARSMFLAAFAFALYAWIVSQLLFRRILGVTISTTSMLVLWLIASFSSWFLVGK